MQFKDQEAKNKSKNFVLNAPGVVQQQKPAGGGQSGKDEKMGV